MKREAKEEGWLNPKKDSKKNEGKSQKYEKRWSNPPKKKRWRRLKKVTKFNSIYNQNSMTSLD
jgi:hypothetical protein